MVAERKDLVDTRVGGTALKTQEVIRKSLNGVLFVDEAYSLTMYGENDFQDTGKEAIAP